MTKRVSKRWFLKVRVSDEDLDRLEALAKAHDTNMSEFIRKYINEQYELLKGRAA